MLENIYQDLKNKKDERKNLIQLKSFLDSQRGKKEFLLYIENDSKLISDLMNHEDPKVRKNIVTIISKLQLTKYQDDIFNLYKNEQQLFVRSSYLTALKEFNCIPYLPFFKQQLDDLLELGDIGDHTKHIKEEIRILQNIILSLEVPITHEFVSLHKETDVILTCNRNHVETTMKQINQGFKKALSSGVLIKTDSLDYILPIRTYNEILFPLSKTRHVSLDPVSLSESILNSDLLSFLHLSHQSDTPFYFRLEIRGDLDLSEKSKVTKKIADEIERLSSRQLINSTSHYEIEIRLMQNKDDTFTGFLKLYTIKDHRFDYRKNSLPTSISPVNAALIVELCSDYFVDNAQILDPFCGVGTLLIERDKYLRTSYLYGLDIYGPAIESAKENALLAKTDVNYIQRDFFTFKHLHLFDEIITNMPKYHSNIDKEALASLYQSFFNRVGRFLKDGSMLFIYSTEEAFMEKSLRKHREFIMIRKYPILKKDNSHLYILQYNELNKD